MTLWILRNRGILKQTLELSSRPEGMNNYPYLTSDQSAPNNLNPKPMVPCDFALYNLLPKGLWGVWALIISFLFCWIVSFINK